METVVVCLSVRSSDRYATDSLTMPAIIQLLIYVLFKMFKIYYEDVPLVKFIYLVHMPGTHAR